ncbi:MAG: PAS domain S-box protein, partial [Gammaproteobacteria bacterium]|nr:PAS domain S-box protein [Gammaproteobacteria bacterium]
PTLTGGPVQAGLGIILMLTIGYFLGRTKDQNQTMIQALEEAHIELERRVARRTAELSAVNERLNDEIAERIQAEEALRGNEIYFRSLIENALDIVTVLNADGTIRYESPSVKQILGYEPDE